MLFTRALVACFLGVLANAAGASAAEQAKWDQPRVSAVAKQLSEATDALYEAFYRQPPATAGTGKARAYYLLKNEVRRIKAEARHLATELGEGKGHDETLPSYEDLMRTVRDAQDQARHVFNTVDVQEKATAARALLDQLSSYYASGVPASN